MTEHWHLQGVKAQVACGPLLAELDIERPMLGLHNLRLPGETITGWLLGVDVREGPSPREQAWPPVDVYTRGCDLVATYREPAGQPFHLEVYWRVLQPRRLVAGVLEAIVSIQTRQWEAYPYATVSSALDVSEGRLHEGCVDFLSRRDWSYVEVSPPGDFDASLRDLPPLTGVQWTYGKRFMERGVIRRLRVRGAFVPIGSGEDEIEQLQSEFASEPPPLTA